MTRAEHNTQRDAVRASLLLAESRTDRHQIYARNELRPCPRCHEPRGMLFCVRCDTQDRAA